MSVEKRNRTLSIKNDTEKKEKSAFKPTETKEKEINVKTKDDLSVEEKAAAGTQLILSEISDLDVSNLTKTVQDFKKEIAVEKSLIATQKGCENLNSTEL